MELKERIAGLEIHREELERYFNTGLDALDRPGVVSTAMLVWRDSRVDQPSIDPGLAVLKAIPVVEGDGSVIWGFVYSHWAVDDAATYPYWALPMQLPQWLVKWAKHDEPKKAKRREAVAADGAVK